jgi:hypothetical protein
MKSLDIARQLLWVNRWLWLLLVLWPWVVALLFLLSGMHPVLEDVEAALQQQSIYGLALVAFTGGSLLGNEQRSRRIVLVLSRDVSRRQYVGALWLAAMLPLLVYGVDLAVTGWLLRVPAWVLAQTLGALSLLGLTLASVAVLASLVLPGVVAGLLSLGVMSVPLLLPKGAPVAQTRLLAILLNGPMVNGTVLNGAALPPSGMLFGAGTIEALLLSAAIFEVAVRVFERRDLRLKVE